jgi:hypothetical protein
VILTRPSVRFSISLAHDCASFEWECPDGKNTEYLMRIVSSDGPQPASNASAAKRGARRKKVEKDWFFMKNFLFVLTGLQDYGIEFFQDD